MNKRKLFHLAACGGALLLLSGCASKTLYHWGNYTQAAADYASQDLTEQEYIDILTEIESNAMGNGKKLGPGMYAEIGTLYLKSGEKSQAIYYYEKERDAWPESAHFMNRLIEGLNKTKVNNPANNEGVILNSEKALSNSD